MLILFLFGMNRQRICPGFHLGKKPLIGNLRLLNGSLEARLTPRIMHWISINPQNLTKSAILWEGENGESRNVTYGEMFTQVQKFANVLKSLECKKRRSGYNLSPNGSRITNCNAWHVQELALFTL